MIDPSARRGEFPALQMTADDGTPYIFLDNPAGTQVPERVIQNISGYLRTSNANRHGDFVTSRRTEETIDAAHRAMADLLNAASPDEIASGPNMTTLSFALSRALAREMQPGDEIVSSRLEHDGNLAPYLILQRERGIRIRYIDVTPDLQLDIESARALIGPRTKLVAITYAANTVGSITDVRSIGALARQHGAYFLLDAVQFAPHGVIDVQVLDCDFLLCSAYKYFGPHQGFLYGKLDVLNRLQADHVRPVANRAPGKFETGTQNHECLAGVVGAVDYLADLGRLLTPQDGAAVTPITRRDAVVAALSAIKEYEEKLAERLITGLQSLSGVRVWGITDPRQFAHRVPTVAITWEGHHPEAIARWLGDHHIFVWSGNFYGQEIVDHLGLTPTGGFVRIGPIHYNTLAEIDRCLEVLSQFPTGARRA